jgi:hypothetical protein
VPPHASPLASKVSRTAQSGTLSDTEDGALEPPLRAARRRAAGPWSSRSYLRSAPFPLRHERARPAAELGRPDSLQPGAGAIAAPTWRAT